MSITVKLKRILRGIRHLLEFAFLEYPRGLDFSLRKKSSGISLVGSHGYALTSKPALSEMLARIDYNDKTFLDIGSGKGGAIVFAHQLGCGRSAGIEFETQLHEIALKNIDILQLSDSCTSFNLDARAFKEYADYDIYFMFNPFEDNIYKEVIDAIVVQNTTFDVTGPKYLICYGGANIDAVISHSCFRLIEHGVCRYRLNDFWIFAMNPNQ